ncbi:ATP-dependent DNA helicase DinG [Anoxybacillus sp. LAT_35]|uniref:ATP-dependent DNA helicase DinG n=1 Tax=Anoxybacillus TaxID=150247 RepID=UPI001EDBCEA1|nr:MULTISPECIES: ATP-dependent DNA helicase DinG [Anoxybacillus]MCG5024530.1 ATP-dependent DNA helicase DinG [Anoxybacillus flavithermus]MCG6198546.1 ATP-dependent DNA helicase DinG [Anoxybacillus sp. LAT_38]MCG3083403.1 ATP-dependent DNA helicase DinG [Anoxybacillus sp. LAT27]MCG6172159.1 ATP-dependent DNA helicase DinG [Anoxybacillus sp. LAT_11]MCG6174424.1 ATP-dependent DNA helicase DinG [Anoxybacillus sp. LAT_31]
MNDRFVVVDIETTGNAPKKEDRIIQIGFVVIEGDKVKERFSTFVQPERDIPPFIQQLTGIDHTMVHDAPPFQHIAAMLVEQWEGAYFVAHNVQFDWAFLQEEFIRSGIQPPTCRLLDTVELARFLMPTQSSYKLNHLAEALSLAHDRPHQADHDAEATAQLLLFLLHKLSRLPLVTLKQLRRHSQPLKSDLTALLDQFIAKKERSLQTNESVLEYEGIALKAWDSPKRVDRHEHLPSFLQWLATSPFVAPFEYREGQKQMMDDVNYALQTCQHALIEAGTGVGKTMAYLLPAVFYAVKQQQPIVVSTYTLQLQKQMIEKELPRVAQLVPFPFTTAVLKGKRNYMSVRKFARTLKHIDTNYDIALTKCQLLVWLTETETGDVDELNLTAGGALFWEDVHSDDTNEEYDFFVRAKEKAKHAHVIITNHSFVMHDLTADEKFLPPYEQLIIDEAHHLEDVAAHFFGRHVSYEYIRLLWTRMNDIAMIHKMGALRSLLGDLEYELNQLFQSLRHYVLRRQKGDGRMRYRFVPWKEYGKEWSGTIELLMRIMNDVQQLSQMINDIPKEDVKPFTTFIDTLCTLQHLLTSDDDDIVRWLEVDAKAAVNAVTVISQPLDLAHFFADQLFSRKRSVILTSATLTTNARFSFIISRLGLDDFYPFTRIIPSPFSYEKQAALMVPTDLPTFPSVTVEQYAEHVAQQVIRIARHTKGRMLVLFTSYELLKQTYAYAKQFNDDQFVLLAQGVSGGNAAKLTRHFQQFEQAILFGTSSFWEGIDLPGSEVTCVVIVRLPFAPPDDPVMEAKSDYIRAKGGNPFYDLSLPQAILRFKQGFGRLIRTKEDRGIIFVFDQRLLTASYSKYFLQSLPPIHVYHAPLSELLQHVNEWL